MKLIVGLGNPGDEYIGTRHNLGFEVLDTFAKKIDQDIWDTSEKLKGDFIKTQDLVLLKPHTYMNNSGLSVLAAIKFFKLNPEDLIVIHDELDLLLGKIKIRKGGGFAGHHGVESIINALNTPDFIRVRLGIGTTEGFLGEHKRINFNADKFVMSGFTDQEHSKVKSMIKHAITGLDTLLEIGLEKAQNQYN